MSIAPATPTRVPGTRAGRTPTSGLGSGRRSARTEMDSGLPSNLEVAAIEHAPDAVIVVDLAGTIRYVNPAFERSTGRHRRDVVGTNVHRLPAAEQPTASIEALWATLRRGEVWAGEFVHRRPDGTLAHTDARVAPIRDAAGVIVGGVSVSRDTTSQRVLETRLEEHLRERASVAAALGAIHSGVTAEATAEAVALALLGLSGFGTVGLFSLEPGGEVAPLVALGEDGRPIDLPGSLPLDRSAYLRERASQGP